MIIPTKLDLGNGLEIHRLMAPQAFNVNSILIRLGDKAIFCDGQLRQPEGIEVPDYVKNLGVKLTAIIISHVHPDHWAGLEGIHAQFPRVPILALPEVIGFIHEHGNEILKQRRAAFGENVISDKLIEADTELGGKNVIPGLAIRHKVTKFLNAESQYQTVISLPDQGILFAFDLGFARGVPMFTMQNNGFDNWSEILTGIKKDGDQISRIFVGHGAPITVADLDNDLLYVQRAKQAFETAKKAAGTPAARTQEFVSLIVGYYPEFDNNEDRLWLGFSGSELFKDLP